MFCQRLYLLDEHCIQRIAMDIAPITTFPLAALLHFADIGVDWFSLLCPALRQFGIHPVTAGAKQQSGQQRFIRPRLPVCPGFVPVQRFLHLDPLL